MGCERHYGAIVREGKVILCKWRSGTGGRRNCGTPSNPTSNPDPAAFSRSHLFLAEESISPRSPTARDRGHPHRSLERAPGPGPPARLNRFYFRGGWTIIANLPTGRAVLLEHDPFYLRGATEGRACRREGARRSAWNPRLAQAREQARATHHARRPAPEVLALMKDWRNQGANFREIARRLNRLNIRPGRGREWYGTSVKGQLGGWP
jgi:hypothetical protein